MTDEERHKNIQGVFSYTGSLNGKTVILIDDIMTTGSTIEECLKILMKHGAEQVIVVVLAINQLGRTYWKTNEPIIECPWCRESMHLLINSKQKNFFYSCYKCGATLNYAEAYDQLVDKIDQEFQ